MDEFRDLGELDLKKHKPNMERSFTENINNKQQISTALLVVGWNQHRHLDGNKVDP